MSGVRNGEQKKQKYVLSEIFYGGQKLHKYFSSSLIRDKSLLACSYIGEERNVRKFTYKNKPSIVFVLILRKVLFYIKKFQNSIRSFKAAVNTV